MKPSMNVSGFGEVLLRLRNIADRVSKETRETAKRAADRIVVNAKRMTPVDTGDLESTIHVEKQYQVETKGRLELVVTAGGIAESGFSTSDYALEVHENYDEAHMGPRTRDKQATESLQIGRHFLTRAHDMERDRLPKEIEATVSKFTGDDL